MTINQKEYHSKIIKFEVDEDGEEKLGNALDWIAGMGKEFGERVQIESVTQSIFDTTIILVVIFSLSAVIHNQSDNAEEKENVDETSKEFKELSAFVKEYNTYESMITREQRQALRDKLIADYLAKKSKLTPDELSALSGEIAKIVESKR